MVNNRATVSSAFHRRSGQESGEQKEGGGREKHEEDHELFHAAGSRAPELHYFNRI